MIIAYRHIPITALSVGVACISLTENTQFGCSILDVIRVGINCFHASNSYRPLQISCSRGIQLQLSFPFAEVITRV